MSECTRKLDNACRALVVVAQLAVFSVLLAGTAHSQGSDPVYSDSEVVYVDDEGYEYVEDVSAGFGIKLGAGFTASPESFLLDLAIPYHVGNGVSIGPRAQVGLAKDLNLVAPTLHIEYAHDLSQQVGGALGAIRPLISAGFGFIWMEDKDRRGGDSQTDFLFNLGVGLSYPLSPQFEVATVLDFNIIPREVLNDDFLFSWQLLQMRLRF